jgi:hypothetical protein
MSEGESIRLLIADQHPLAGLVLLVGGMLALISALVLPATRQPVIGHLTVGGIVSTILGIGCTVINVIVVLMT